MQRASELRALQQLHGQLAEALEQGDWARIGEIDSVIRSCLQLLAGLPRLSDEVREAKRYQQKGQSLEKCLNILNGLNGALDYENGGELVQGLARLYDYCIYRLSDVSVSLSLEGLDEVVSLLGVLREGWEGVRDARQ